MIIVPSYPHAHQKRDEMGRIHEITVKRVAPCRCLDGHVNKLYEVTMAWEPDRRSNFFSPSTHPCTVTYILGKNKLRVRPRSKQCIQLPAERLCLSSYRSVRII